MNANGVNTVKCLVVQSQSLHVILDRQTGQLLPVSVKTSSHAAQNVTPISDSSTWSVHALLVICCRLKIIIRSFIFLVLYFPDPKIPVHTSPPFSRSGIFRSCIFSAPLLLVKALEYCDRNYSIRDSKICGRLMYTVNHKKT